MWDIKTGYIKEIINDNIYIFIIEYYDDGNNINDLFSNKTLSKMITNYKILDILQINLENNIYITKIREYEINKTYGSNKNVFLEYVHAYYYKFMENEEWKYFKNGFDGLYKHYNKFGLKEYEYYHSNGKINGTYIHSNIKYTYIDGKLYQKNVYYDNEHNIIKKYGFLNSDNFFETKIYNKNGKCVEQNVEKNVEIIYPGNESKIISKIISKIYNYNEELKCECTYIINDNDNDKNIKFIDDFIVYSDIYNYKYKFDLDDNMIKYEKLDLSNNIIELNIYQNNETIYKCEYYSNRNKKIECELFNSLYPDQKYTKYIEYFESGNVKRKYYLKNNKFIYDYIEFHPNLQIYRKCYFDISKKINDFIAFDTEGNKIIKSNNKYKSFIRYPKYQLYPFIKFNQNKDIFKIITKIRLQILNYLKDYIGDKTEMFVINYNILRILNGVDKLAYRN
jgi:hypothetical protein